MPYDSTTGSRSGKKSKRKKSDSNILLETCRKSFLPSLVRLANSRPIITRTILKEIIQDPNLTMWEKNFLSHGIKSTIKGDGEFIKFILTILYGKNFQSDAIDGDFKVIEKDHVQKTDEELNNETIEIAKVLKQIIYEKQCP